MFKFILLFKNLKSLDLIDSQDKYPTPNNNNNNSSYPLTNTQALVVFTHFNIQQLSLLQSL